MTERFEDHGIIIPPNARGNVKVVCPQCSHSRSRAHTRERCLSVDTENGIYGFPIGQTYDRMGVINSNVPVTRLAPSGTRPNTLEVFGMDECSTRSDYALLPTTYVAARVAGIKTYFAGKPCPKGHVLPRYASNWKCVECAREDCRKYYERHHEQERQRNRAHIAAHPEANAERSRRIIAKETPEQKAARLAWGCEYKRRNADRVRVHNENRRALKIGSGAKITIGEWRALKAHYGNKCLCCGVPESDVTLTQDHVVPLSHGGIHHISNIQPLCRSCNARKGTKRTDFRTEVM